MLKVYQESFILRTCNCDFQGQWRPSAILETMQETAGAHSHLLGCGRDALLKDHIVWVLTRSEVHMHRYPKVMDQVTVETFPMPNRRWFFPRYYLFKDQDGQLLGYAGTLWALLDMNTRKMLPPGDVASLIPNNSDLTPPMGLPSTVEAIEGEMHTVFRMPQYTDLDVNQHVNNTRYADWACDALGVEMMRSYCLDTLVINYAAEVLPHQEMELQIIKAANRCRVAGFHEGKMHFELSVALSPRK
ncbi:MAG: hypothetical protein E7324_03475 [Clostridiales bacterium]|nr:hypothetical protein [Clostridiales bacterium]